MLFGESGGRRIKHAYLRPSSHGWPKGVLPTTTKREGPANPGCTGRSYVHQSLSEPVNWGT